MPALRPLVSTIVPVHNGAATLARALESVLAQGDAPVELLVVDDGSTDASAAVAQRFPEVRLLGQPQKGPAAARNAGIRAAAGELLAFNDADDSCPCPRPCDSPCATCP
jgi:glycosyltransferase involved in cell wall biosynthesis